MSKPTVIVIFMAILVLGMATKETQGANCVNYFEITFPEVCEANWCTAECLKAYKNGKGTCWQKFCQCVYDC
ncbi:S locus-related glycoprotein 1 binding pollen coat protein [Arabidopsis suecica]|uniref:S locus-related glycoprotein 1 binding pollen coat protein n=1 Tax=Arabidopsis suecica TaxID=45249 RepID=A0A8T2HCN3_ARASU|nr:S locus-related glycoprotein 1 binding pollen coat protein [Arabidopsis suecica]